MASRKEVAELYFTLKADIAQLKTGVAQASAQLSGFGTSIARIGKIAAGAFAAIAGAFAVDQIVGGLRSIIDEADRFEVLAQRTGIASEALQKFTFAGEQAGASSEQLQKGLLKLNVAVADLLTGQKSEGADALRALGLNLDAIQKSSEPTLEAFYQLADAFNALPDGIDKTALAVKIFGARLAADLIPALNEGREGLNALEERYVTLGGVIGGDVTAAAEQFNDLLAELSVVTAGVGKVIASELVPPLRDALEGFIDWAVENDNLKRSLEAVGVATRGVISFVEILADIIGTVIDRVEGLRKAVFAVTDALDFLSSKSVRSTTLSEYFDVVTKKAGEAKDGIGDFLFKVPDFAKDFAGVGDAVAETGVAFDDAKKKAEEYYLKLDDGAERIKKSAAAERLRDALSEGGATGGGSRAGGRRSSSIVSKDDKRGFEAFFRILEEEGKITDALRKVKTGTEEAASTMEVLGEVGKGAFDTIGDAIFDVVEGGKLSFADFARSVISSITRIALSQAFQQIFKLIPSFGSIGSSLGGLFGFRAGGGSVSAGGAYVVGERGPELFLPGVNGYVVPNGVGGAASVVINNMGPPLAVRSVEQDRNIIAIAVSASVDAVTNKFADDMRTGYGSFSQSLALRGRR